MKKALALLLLALAGCKTVKPVQTCRIVVRYNDNVLDTLVTDYKGFKVGKLNYINECSCDGYVLQYLH